MNMRKLALAAALLSWPRGASAYDEARFLEPLKLEGMARPRAVAASIDRYYVVDDKKSQLYILDSAGKFLKSAGRPGAEPTAFSAPQGVAVGPDGNVYVADTGNSRVQILDRDGNFLWSFGAKGDDLGQLKYPQSVAVGADGRVFVSDTGNDRVEVFTSEGVFLYAFGEKGKGPGQMRSPTRLAIDNADAVYILDSGNERILKFDAGAKFVKEVNLLGTDFALDDFGFAYLLDPKAGKVKEQDPQGFLLGAFGSKGAGPGQMKSPSGVSVAPDGTVLVLDPGDSRILRVELTNKLKTAPVPHNTSAKLFVSGPKKVWPVAAQLIAARPGGGSLLAYVAKEGQFVEFDGNGKPMSRFGSRSGKDPSYTKGAGGFAVSAKHGIFVSDADGDKLQRFTADGKFEANFAQSTGLFDSKKKEGRVRSPRAVAINEKGTVYVADAGNRRVDAFSPDGAFVFGIGPQLGPYELQEPVGVAWDDEGFVFILDRKLKKVFKCQPSGGFVMAWGEEGTGPGQFVSPVAIAFDGRNYVYVLDQDARRVCVFSKDGGWVTSFFSGGKEERSLQSPQSLLVSGEDLIIADPAKGKVLGFTLHPRLAPPASVSTSAVEGIVELKWKAAADPWFSLYRVYRSSQPQGPFEAVGTSKTASFKDATVTAYQSYWYRVAVEAQTGDVGPQSLAVPVFVAGAFNRSPVEIKSVDIGDIFSANYKWYLKNPVGKAVVVNNVNVPFQNVKLSFRLKDFMDFGTDSEPRRIDPQQIVEFPLMATLNNKILEVTEDTPILAEFTLTYFESGKQQTVSITKPLRVYSRNAITWDKPARIATFITSNDTPVQDFQRKVLNEAPPEPSEAEPLNAALKKAIRLWSALGVDGVKFQQAANNPFEHVSEDPAFPVDYTQFPRETLKHKSGQCDDMATLVSSLLEGASVKTALLDYPGHIAMMFDTGAVDPAEAGLPESELIHYNDGWWVPLETTLVDAPFVDAQRKAANDYRDMAKAGKASIIDPRKAWETFEPATMPATDWSPETPAPEGVAKRFAADAAAYAKVRYKFLRERYEGLLAKDGKDVEAMDQLGILQAEAGEAAAAGETFLKVLAVDADDAAARNNLGSLAFTKGDYAAAEKRFLEAAKLDGDDPGVWLNLAKTAAKLKDADKLKVYGERALSLDGSFKTAVQALSH